jgi:hypothetical protein
MPAAMFVAFQSASKQRNAAELFNHPQLFPANLPASRTRRHGGNAR